jgi:hypothetical protein
MNEHVVAFRLDNWLKRERSLGREPTPYEIEGARMALRLRLTMMDICPKRSEALN